MMNKIRKVDSSASPLQARVWYGPATVGVEWDIAAAVDTLVINPDADGRREVHTSGGAKVFNPASTKYVVDHVAEFNAAAGNNTLAWLGAFRSIVKGATMTKTGNSVSAIHGVYWVTGTNASVWPLSAILAEIHNGVTVADAAFVAMTGLAVTPRALYGVATLDMDINSAQYGLDLSTNSYTGGAKDLVGYTQADILLSNEIAIFSTAGVPGATDGVGYAGPGSLAVNRATGKWYSNTGTKAAPTWTAVSTAP